MALNKAAKTRLAKDEEAREKEKAKRRRKLMAEITQGTIWSLHNENPKILALNKFGFNDTRIGQFINKNQSSVHGYRTSNVQPAAEIDEMLDEMIEVAIETAKANLDKITPLNSGDRKTSARIRKLIESTIAFAESALDA